MKKRWLRLMFWMATAVAFILLLGLGLLHTPPVQRFVFDRLHAFLLKKSSIDVRASRFRFNLFSSEITLEDLVVRAASAPDLPPLFRANRIDLILDIPDAFRGFWNLESLQIESPQIRYIVGRDGKTNLPKSASSSGGAPDYLIERGEVHKGLFQYEDARDGIALTLPQWQLHVEGTPGPREHRFSFSTSQEALFKYRAYSIPISRLTASATLRQTELQVESADLAAANSRISLKGSINDFSNPTLNLQINPALDLGGISQAAKLSNPLAGSISGTVQANGKPENLRLEARLKGTGVSAGSYRNAEFDMKSQAEWNSGQMSIRSLQIDSPQGSIRASVEWSTKPGRRANFIKAGIRDFDLAPIWELLRPPFNLASRGDGDITLRWYGSFSPSGISGSAHLNLSSTRANPGPNLLPLSGTVDAQMKSGQILANLQPLTALGATISGTFSLQSFEDVEGDFAGHAPDIDVLISKLSLLLGGSDNPLEGMKISGPLHFNARATGTVKQLTITISAETPELSASQLRHLSAKTDATFQGSHIGFRSAITLPQSPTMFAQGALELGGHNPELTLDAHGDRIPATAIGAMLDSSIPMSGNLKAELHLSGSLDNLAGSAAFSGEDLSLYRQHLGHLDIGLRLEDKEVQSTQFRLLRDPQNPDSDRIDGSFAYGLDSGQFKFQATGKGLKWKQPVLPDGSPIEATINLTASGSGTTAQPSIDAKIETDYIRLGQTPLGTMSLDAALRGDKLTIDAAAPRFSAAAKIHVAGKSPYPFDGEVKLADTDLSLLGLKAANGQSLTGVLGAGLTGSGNLREWAQAHLSAQITTLRLQAGDLEVHNQNPIRAAYADNSLDITSATLLSGNSKLDIAGTVPLRQPAQPGNLSLKGQLDLAQAAAFMPKREGFAASGIMDVDLAFTGTMGNLNSSGTVAVKDGTVKLPGIPTALTDISVRADVRNDSLVLQQADAAWGQGRIALTGELPFGLLPKKLPVEFPRKNGPARFSLDMTNLGPEATGLLPQGMSGLISLHAEGQADSADLHSLKARIDFGDLSLKMNELSISQNQPSTILVRDGVATVSKLSFSGTETNIDVSGSAGLLPGSSLNLRLDGNLNAALLTFRNRDLKAAGKMKVELVVSGKLESPKMSGSAAMTGGKLSLRNPRIVADSLRVRLELDPKKISIQQFAGTLNGGAMTLTGTVGYGSEGLKDINLKATVQDFFLDFPEGLKSSSSGNLTITSSDDIILVGGNVRVQESSYREPLEVSSQLMSYLKGQQIVVEGRESDVLLNRVRLNIALRTETPLLVQNNLAKVEATANLRLVGPFNEPSMVGRVTLNNGGEIILNQRTYYIDRGVITLTNETQIEPQLDIQAETKAGDYDITLQLTGMPERISTTLTSEPPLSEPDILSLLLTGKTTSETQGREFQMARTQALALIAGQAGSELAGEARRAFHLSTFRIDPGLIASESDPGARLTLGEDITKDLSLVYSMNLTNGGDQIWAAQYEVIRRLTTQATKQQDNSYRFEFHHDLVFGGTSGRRRARRTSQPFEIGSIRLEGGGPFSDKTLLNKFGVKSGQKYDFPKVQKGLDRLHEFYAKEKHLEADIRMHRETQDNAVDLNLKIEPGPVVTFEYEGAPIPSGVKDDVEKAWSNGVFDIERTEDAVRAIRLPLIQAGFLQSKVVPEINTDDGRKTVRFHITPGARYANVPIVFPGASEISAARLAAALDQADLRLDVYADPQKVVDYLSRYYHDRGYLQARVGTPDPKLDPGTGTGSVSIPIQEGPLFTIGDLEFSGNHAFTYDELWSVIPTSSGSSYDPNTLRDSIKAMENLYHSKGYNDVSITFRVVQDTAAAHANLTFYIVERKQSIIRDIDIEGTRGTSQDFVRRQLDFQTGEPLDFTKINETRRRLYSTSVYSSVDFQTEEIPGGSLDERVKDMRVRIRVREIQPYRMQYGLFYDTERGIGGLFEAENRNFLGRASDLGLKLRYDSDLKEGRLYFFQPFVTKIHVKMDAGAFVQRETRPAFSTNRIGFSLFQERKLPRSFRLDYGYRYDHVRWNGLPPDPTIFQASVPVARLVATVTRDSRDSVLDATRGEFSSHSLEFGPRLLGSEIGFTRYYGQYFRYVPLDKFFMKPQKGKEERTETPRLIYAGALRLGLTSAFGGKTVISPERFFAGGGTTMRGFEQDRLGPLETLPDGTQRPFGGEALFLFNNEIRFPIFGILQGVGFVDIGNVYPRISDFNFNIRKSAGAGLRVKIKYIPLRFDYGWKLDRRPGESPGAFFFSIGQAF